MIVQQLPAFSPVAAGSKAICMVPKYALTLSRVQLRLGGTTFTKALVTQITCKVGTHTVLDVTGSALDKINKYKGLYDEANHLTIDWNERDATDIIGKEIGGIDMSRLADKDNVYIEVTISASASAPTLSARAFFTPPQGNDLIKKLLKVTTATLSAGRNDINFNADGAFIQRAFLEYTGSDWCNGTATSSAAGSAASNANVGNGVMGAITVTTGATVGDYWLNIVDATANAAHFTILDPIGRFHAQKGSVATAYSSGGLAFTLADGTTDFVAGDGFKISVSEVSNGNVADLRVVKDGVPVWDDISCADNRFMQKEYRKVPQPLMYIYDAIVDNNQSGALVTAGVRSLQFRPNLTLTDTLTVYFEVLDTDPYHL